MTDFGMFPSLYCFCFLSVKASYFKNTRTVDAWGELGQTTEAVASKPGDNDECGSCFLYMDGFAAERANRNA